MNKIRARWAILSFWMLVSICAAQDRALPDLLLILSIRVMKTFTGGKTGLRCYEDTKVNGWKD